MSIERKPLFVVFLFSVAMGCADARTDFLASVNLAQLTESSGRTVAEPIVRIYNPGNNPPSTGSFSVPVDSTTQKPISAWNGSYAEMLAADEYVKCVSEVVGVRPSRMANRWDEGHPSMAISVTSDPAMSRIETYISENGCASEKYLIRDGAMVFPSSTLTWIDRRTNVDCNQSVSDGTRVAAIALPALNLALSTPITSFLSHIDDSDVGNFIVSENPDNPFGTVDNSYDYLYHANVGLCFANRLEQLLEEAEVFTTSTQEHLMLLGLAYERSQDAMMRFGYLLKLAAKPTSDMPMDNLNGPAIGAYLRYWLDSHSEQVDIARDNFLQAMRLTSTTATTLATYLERQAGARWTSKSAANAFDRDWGVGSARDRLMSLVHGGGVLRDLWGDNSAENSMVNWFAGPSVSTTDPRIMVLLNLARQSDALFLHVVTNLTTPDVDLSGADDLYRETELGLRVFECVKSDATLCTKSALRTELPALSDVNQFTLYKDYGITLEHARNLTRALFDVAVQSDLVEGGSRTSSVFHIIGNHVEATPTGYVGSPDGWIKLDSKAALVPYDFEDRAQFGTSVCSKLVPDWDQFARCPSSYNHGWIEEPFGRLGAVSALSFAREVLFGESNRTSDSELQSAIGAGLKELERLLGKRSLVYRSSSIDMIEPKDSNPTSLVNPSAAFGTPGLRSAAKSASFSGVNGVDRDLLETQDKKQPSASIDGGAAASEFKLVSWEPSSSLYWPRNSSLLLRSVSGPEVQYRFIAEQPCSNCRGDGFDAPSSTIVEDGLFANLVAKITAVQDTDWSRPKYDGFGLPSRWVPPADASLMGGNAGEESYQYLLRSAKSAAEEATTAVKTAIDKLVEEAHDEIALTQAETKASTIADLETSALCGSADGCNLKTTPVYFRWDLKNGINADCAKVESEYGQRRCMRVLAQYQDSIPERLWFPEIVANALGKASTSFDGYNGSELQKVLIRQWNAGRLLVEAKDQAAQLAIAYGAQLEAIRDGADLASDDEVAALAQLVSLESKPELQDEFGDYACTSEKAAETEARNRKRDQEKLVGLYCMAGKADRCGDLFEGDCDKPTATDFSEDLVEYVMHHSTSSGSPLGQKDEYFAANVRCYEAAIKYRDLVSALNTAETVHDRCAGLEDLRADSAEQDLLAIKAARNAARQKRIANQSAGVAQTEQAKVQVGAHSSVIGQTVNEALQALAELKQLKLRAAAVEARADLEKNLASGAYNANSELRRKYRSYDMWRARALIESARRLAVAARRSIEARFVVDLSTLRADQSFVASPSIWADEIYESDLNAPEVVGLSRAPKIEGAIYPNKLLDYVGNLERFVQGYTITYPTSVSLPDTEIMTFGGPDQVNATSSGNAETLKAESGGWRFFCANSGAWIAHPGTGQFPIATRLATACNGVAPVLAKLGFWLDPWGALNGAWSRPVFSDRHNVRWRRLAVNLVGTGIRDCSKSGDSMNCYTNPFIRFNLVHAGPSWQTNYALDWRALDIPSAHIEGGKALAAEEWLEPITNSWNAAYVANIARGELFGRPAAGSYELVLEVTPDVRLDRIERVQLLVEQDYWVRQNGGRGVYGSSGNNATSGTGSTTGTGGVTGAGGSTGTGGASSNGGTVSAGGSSSTSTTSVVLSGSCAPGVTDNDPVFEDFEDGNKILASHEGRLGVWFGFRAGTTCTASPPTNDTFLPTASFSPSNGSLFVGNTWGSGCESDWSGGGLGVIFLSNYVNGVETQCTSYNLSKYTGISFDARGTGTARFEVASTQNTNENFAGYEFAVSDSWSRYTIRWNQLTQNTSWNEGILTEPLNPALLWKLQWLMKSASYSFSIDNISFISN